MSSKKKRKKKASLYELQGGKCYYCGVKMDLVFGENLKKTDHYFATIEHLDDKFSKVRGKGKKGSRVVLACYACNSYRGQLRNGTVHIKELRRRSGRGDIFSTFPCI